MHAAAIEHVVHFCGENGVDRALSACLVASLEQGTAAGPGDDDLVVVLEIFCKHSGRGETA
jgi:hypothetical protein